MRLESEERIASANQRSSEANERAAASYATAAQAESAASAAVLAENQLRKENLQLSIDLEREKRLRLEAEERGPDRQPSPVAVSSPDVQSRTLTAAQLEMLRAAMDSFPGAHVAMVELADPEAGALARQITSVLERAHWNVAVSRVGALSPAQQGIICTHGPGDSAAFAFVAAMRSMNLMVYERSESADQFQIIVGLKPKA